MSENRNSLDGMNNGGQNDQDNDLEQLLFQVFGSKENLEKEKKRQLEEDALAGARMIQKDSSPDIKFEQDPELLERSAARNRAQKLKKDAKVVSAAEKNSQKKIAPQNKQVPKTGEHRQEHRNNTGDKKPVQNGGKQVKKPVQNNNKIEHERKNALKEKNTSANAVAKPSVEQNKGTKNSGPKFLQKIERRSGKKKAAAILGILGGIILLLVIIAVSLFFFYTSLFGKYHGKRNNDAYEYDSREYTNESDTMTAEEAEAALRKQLEGTAKDPMKDKDVMNVMLIGEDLRDTENEERGNTDVMLMISLNKKAKTITMTSFLRDAWVEIDDYGMAKLNAAYYVDGPSLLKSTIEKYYGVSIDKYVIVNFKTFVDIIDTIGGIKMDVTDEEAIGMQQPMAEQNNLLKKKKGTDYLYKGGKQLKLNGNQALAFARLRYVGNADYERTQRQRRVITEIIKETKNLSFVKINDLARKIFPQVKLDITTGEFASLLLNCLEYMDYDIQEMRIPADGLFTEDIIDGLSVLSPDFNANRELLINKIYGTGDESSDNASDVSGEAVEAAGEAQGYTADNNYTEYNNGYDNYADYNEYYN